MDPFDNPLISKPAVICDDRNNPPSQENALCETFIAMCSREGATILRTLGWNIADFPPGAFFTIRNSIDEKGVITSALVHTAPGGRVYDEYIIPSVPVPCITFKSNITKDGATFAEFIEQHSSEDLSEVSTNQQSFEDLTSHETKDEYEQLLREQHAQQNPNYNPQELGEDGRPLGVMEEEWIARAENQALDFSKSELDFFEELGRRNYANDMIGLPPEKTKTDAWKTDKEGVTFTEEQIKESRAAYLEPYLKQTSEKLETLIKDLDWIEKFEDFCNEHNIDYKTMELRKD